MVRVQPGFRIKARLFHELSRLLASGVTLPAAAAILAAARGSGRAERRLAQLIKDGAEPTEAFRGAGFDEADAAALGAAATAGRMDDVMRMLASHYEEMAKAMNEVRSRCLYPVLMLHLAPLLLSIPQAIVSGGWAGYFITVGRFLGGLYAASLLCLLFGWLLVAAYARSATAAAGIGRIPVLGTFLEIRSGARFGSVLSIVIRSGAGILRGIELAGKGARSGLIHEAAGQAVVAIRGGESLTGALAGRPGIPTEIARAIAVGEASGHLDDELSRAAADLDSQMIRRLQFVSEWVPRILYIAMTLYVGYSIFSMVMGIGSAMEEVLQME
ncbi:MAG: hypothetical protein Fur0032_16970 [Terrimicrobiaceae bacterium]